MPFQSFKDRIEEIGVGGRVLDKINEWRGIEPDDSVLFNGSAKLKRVPIPQVPLPIPRKRLAGLLGFGRKTILLPSTVAANWSPGFNPRLFRIFLEITICDF
jgi:hypothetical protein